jgi:sucrose-6F-phosphate phosphohydrolase
MTRFLFVTDLDNTLVGDDAALKSLNTWLAEHREEYGTKIVYATGRSLTLYRELEQEQALLKPDVLVASVGTVIYPGAEDEPDPTWSELLSQGWDRDEVVAIAAHFADLVLQMDSEQGDYKVSYHISPDVAADMLPELNTRLVNAGLEITLIYSGSKDLDIVPASANKGEAINFLRHQWAFEPGEAVACGDSGNDLALFTAADHRSVIVGNAHSELRQWYETNPASHRYMAQAHYAAGIIEGLKHFGLMAE